MKSHTEKHKVKLNPCKYCGETEVEIIYNRFNNQEHCVAQCKCGAYVQRYCINPLLAPELKNKGIIIAVSMDEAKKIFHEKYPERTIVDNYYAYCQNGAYLFEMDKVDNNKLYCCFPW